MTAAERAMELVADGMVLGLGTGHAATAFVTLLGERVRAGLHVRGVPTSLETTHQARSAGIPLVPLEAVDGLDLAVDGADEVDGKLNLIKGYGGALVREKIVAASAKLLVILVGPEKLVTTLGQRGRLPVEIIPFSFGLVQRRLAALGTTVVLRDGGGRPFVTDNGNWILDCAIQPLADPAALERDILAIPGVVDTGLFLGMASRAFVQHGERSTDFTANTD